MKASDLVRRALLEIGVIATSETPTADQQADGLSELAMLADTEQQRLNTVISGWPSEMEPFTALDAVPGYWLHFLQLALALAVSAGYGVSASAELLQRHNRALRIVERKSMPLIERKRDATLQAMTAPYLLTGV